MKPPVCWCLINQIMPWIINNGIYMTTVSISLPGFSQRTGLRFTLVSHSSCQVSFKHIYSAYLFYRNQLALVEWWLQNSDIRSRLISRFWIYVVQLSCFSSKYLYTTKVLFRKGIMKTQVRNTSTQIKHNHSSNEEITQQIFLFSNSCRDIL